MNKRIEKIILKLLDVKAIQNIVRMAILTSPIILWTIAGILTSKI